MIGKPIIHEINYKSTSSVLVGGFLFAPLQENICAHTYPGGSQNGKKGNRGRGERTEVLRSCCRICAALVQVIKGIHVAVEGLEISVIDLLLAVNRLHRVFDQLTCGITKGGRAVENGGDKSVLRIFQKELCRRIRYYNYVFDGTPDVVLDVMDDRLARYGKTASEQFAPVKRDLY